MYSERFDAATKYPCSIGRLDRGPPDSGGKPEGRRRHGEGPRAYDRAASTDRFDVARPGGIGTHWGRTLRSTPCRHRSDSFIFDARLHEDGVHSGHRAGNRKDDQGQVCPKAPVVDRTGDHEGLRTM